MRIIKRYLIAFVALAAVFFISAAVFAVANGQSEGKMMSGQKQLLADGDMEASDTSAWSGGVFATLTKEGGAANDGSQVLRIAYNGTTNPYTTQSILTSGVTYRISGWTRSDGTAQPRIKGGSSYWWVGTTSTAWQRFDFVVVSDTSIPLFRSIIDASGYTEWDDILVTEYAGETTSAQKQLVADGDMEASGTADWTPIFNATLTKQSCGATDGTKCLRVARSDTNNPRASQTVLTVGKTYRVTGWARGDGNGTSPEVYLGSSAVAWNGSSSNQWQRVDFLGVADGTALYLRATTIISTNYAEFDDIVVTEYTGKTTSAQKQLLADGDMEASGTGSWTANSGAVLSKQSGAAVDGSQILRTELSSDTFVSAYQEVLTIGKRYRLTGWARSDGTYYPAIIPGILGSYAWLGTTSTSWQRIDVAYEADGTLARPACTGPSGSGYCEFDDLMVTAL